MSLPGDDQPQQPWQQQDPQQAYGQQPGYQWQPSAPTSGSATAALILGIVGVVLCPLLCSVPALILGYKAKNEIAASGGRMSGAGQATAGIVLGWIGTAFAVLGVLLFLSLLA